jgi:hypothetical protein
MRGLDREGNPSELSDENPHPFPVTMDLLADGIKRLRANETENAEETIVLWRGLRNVALPAEFLQHGGSEKAPMSTTRDLSVAVQYSASGCAVLLKLVVEGFHQLGVRRCFDLWVPLALSVVCRLVCWLAGPLMTQRPRLRRLTWRSFPPSPARRRCSTRRLRTSDPQAGARRWTCTPHTVTSSTRSTRSRSRSDDLSGACACACYGLGCMQRRRTRDTRERGDACASVPVCGMSPRSST